MDDAEKLIPGSSNLSSKDFDSLHETKAVAWKNSPAYSFVMELKNESVVVGDLTTIGRKTRQPRTVELRLVYAGGRFYATTSRAGDKHWCQNMMQNPAVEVTVCGQRFTCVARQVNDTALRRRILTLRDAAALLDRVVFEITPH